MLLKTLKIGNLSIQVPIIQGGMGVGISLSGLASAVANEGGVGVISAAGLGVIYKNLSKNYLEASILGLKEENNSNEEREAAFGKVVDMLLEERIKAKANKDWATSDKIRDKLTALGFAIKDTKDGCEWKLNK